MAIAVCAVVLLWSGCRQEPITWRTPLHHVIFFHDTLSWEKLVPDTLWTEGEEGLRLNASSRRSVFPSEDWLPPLDTAWSTTVALPFIGGPIPVAPGAEIWGEQEQIFLGIPDVDLRRVRLGGGILSISATSTVQGPLELRYTIEGGIFPENINGGNSTIVLSLSPDEPAAVTIPLEGVELDLFGPNGLDFSRLFTAWEVAVPGTAQEPVGLFGSDELFLSVALEDLEVAQVEGYFGQRALNFEDTLRVGDLGALQSLDIAWTDVGLDLQFVNPAGLDIAMQLDAIQRLDSFPDAEPSPLLDPALGSTIFLPRAEVVESNGMASWSIQEGEATLALGTDGALAGFLSSVPEAFMLSGQAELNPFGDVSGGYDRVDLQRLPELNWTLTAPLAIGASRIVWIDTLSPVVPEGVGFDGTLHLSCESSLPVGAALEMSLVEVPQLLTLLHPGPNQDWRLLDPIVLEPGMGSLDAPVRTDAALNLAPWHFDALRQGARLRVKLTCSTPEEGAQFEVDQRVVMQGHLEGDAIISIE